MKQMSVRQQRVGEQIKAVVSAELLRGDFADARIGGMVNVPHVWVSPDLRQSRVYYTYLSQPNATRDDMRDLTLALNAEAYRLQKALGQQLTMKYTPKIHFFYDAQTQEAKRLESVFNRVLAKQESTPSEAE